MVKRKKGDSDSGPNSGTRAVEAKQEGGGEERDDSAEKIRSMILQRCAKQPKDSPLVIVSAIDEIARESNFKRSQVLRQMRILQNEGKVMISEPETYASLGSYLFSPLSNWFWLAIIATILSLLMTLASSGFVLYLRYFFGTLLILFLPGYSLLELLYARRIKEEPEEESAFTLARIALSVGLSLVIVPSVALILNYTSFGITVVSLSLVLASLTFLFLIVGANRKHAQYRLTRYALEKTEK